jgi:ATP-binding cassette, subfamily B, bacterial HlyB/CyaB
MSKDTTRCKLAAPDWVWALGSLAQVHRIPFDAQLVLRQNPPPHRLSSLIATAEGLGLKTGLKSVAVNGLQRLVFPCVAVLQPAITTTEATPDTEDSVPAEPTHRLACYSRPMPNGY